MARFDIVLTPDLWDGGYTVTVPALPGCITHGDTIDDALVQAREAIECWIGDDDDVRLAKSGARFDLIVLSVDVPNVEHRSAPEGLDPDEIYAGT